MTTSSVGNSTFAVPDGTASIVPAPSDTVSNNHEVPGRPRAPSPTTHAKAAAAFSHQTFREGLGAPASLPDKAAPGIRTLDRLSRSTLPVKADSAHALAASGLNVSGSSLPFANRGARALQAGSTGQATPTSGTLPGASIEEFDRLNKNYDTQEGYLPRNSEANAAIAQKIEDGLQQEMTGYPPQVIQFQQRQTHLQGMLAELPDSERQFYGGVIATLSAAFQLETSNDKRYAIEQKLTGLENAVRDEANRVRNDPVDRVLSQFNPPMGVAYLNKEDRESVDGLDKLRDEFFDAENADEREEIFQEASGLKGILQERIAAEVDKRQRVKNAQWKEANGEVDRILDEAQKQTDPAKRYELLGRQLFQTTPGQDELKDKVVLAFTQRMHESRELRDKLDTWHDQVSGPLNAHSVGAAKRYTDILKDLPPVSGDYVRDLSDRYTAVLKDASYKDYSITPAARAEKLAGQVLEGIDRVLLGLTPLAPLADLLPSALPDNVRMGLDYGSAFLGILGGEVLGAAKEISLAGNAISGAARDAEAASMAGKGGSTSARDFVQAAGQGVVKAGEAESTLNPETRATERALAEKTLAETGPAVDFTSQLAHQSVASDLYGSLETYADPDVSIKDLRPADKSGIRLDAKGDRYIELRGKAYHVRYDKDYESWRVFKKGIDLKPQYSVRLNDLTQKWELNTDTPAAGGMSKIDDKVRSQIIRLLNEGELTRGGIARKLGISPTPVAKVAREENIALLAADSLRRLPLTPATRQEVIDLLKQGQLSRTQIAKQFDIARSTVNKIAKDNQIPPKGSYRSSVSRDIRQEAVVLLKKGELSCSQIGKQLGIATATVLNIARKDNIPISAAASLRALKITPGTRQEIIRLLEDGAMTQRAIANQVGVATETVRNIAAREGIRAPVPRNLTPGQIDQVFALKDQGKPTREIASIVKLSERKVRDIFANYNANTYKRSWWNTTPENRTSAIQQLDAGTSPKDVARNLDLPLETVRGIANQHRMARDSLAGELLAEGKSADEVARSLGMSSSYTKGLARRIPEGSHDIRFTAKDREAAMDMFEKGYTREDVATKLGISPWKSRSLANEFRKKTMDSLTPQQLDDILRALDSWNYSFTTGDLAQATHLPENTITVVEQEYAGGFFISRPRSPQAGPSRADLPSPTHHQEWVPPLSEDEEIQAMRAMDEGLSLKDAAARINQPYAAIARLYEEDLPLVAPRDDLIEAPPTEHPQPATTAFSEEDKVEIRNLAQRDGLSASFIANLFNAPLEDIQRVLSAHS